MERLTNLFWVIKLLDGAFSEQSSAHGKNSDTLQSNEIEDLGNHFHLHVSDKVNDTR